MLKKGSVHILRKRDNKIERKPREGKITHDDFSNLPLDFFDLEDGWVLLVFPTFSNPHWVSLASGMSNPPFGPSFHAFKSRKKYELDKHETRQGRVFAFPFCVFVKRVLSALHGRVLGCSVRVVVWNFRTCRFCSIFARSCLTSSKHHQLTWKTPEKQ